MSNQDPIAADKDFSAKFLASRKRRRRNRMLTALVIIGGVAGGYYWMTQQADVVVEDEELIVAIGYGDIENAIPAAGTLQPKEVVPIGARASGELIEILVEVGDYVEKDQIIARIDAREQELRVTNSELNLENQRNQLGQRELAVRIAENNFARTQALFASDASTEQELENAENSLLQAQTNLRNLEISILQSETSLEEESVQLSYTEITAPFNGTIISLDRKEGETLNASQTTPTVMQIADLTTLTVETEISEADIQALEEGVDVYFTTLGSGDRRWYGRLRKIDPMGTVSNNVVLFNGSFDVDNSDRELYPNMTTQVFFVTSSARDVLTVPLGALTFVEDERQGERVSENGEGGANREDMAARFQEFRNNGGEIPPEMRAQIEQRMREGGFGGGGRGGFPGGGGGFPGGGGNFGGFGGGGDQGGGGSTGLGLAGSIALNEPRNATVEVVLDDDSREVREIVVGAMDRVNAEVISGLKEGDRIVAGLVIPELESDDDDDNNSGNDWQRQRMMRGFF